MMRKDVVYTLMQGGLGNQLFQYAAGRSLADQLECELVLDKRQLSQSKKPLSSDGKQVENQFLLDCFDKIRYLRDVPLPASKSDNYIKYKFEKIFYGLNIFRDKRPRMYDPNFLHQSNGTYLRGHWQSPKYFLPIEKQLRQDLTFTTPLNEAGMAMARQIKEAKNSVSLHVRRGDYVDIPRFAALQPSYYYSALQYIEETIREPLTCFIFSNDLEWIRSNMRIQYETITVDINDESAAYDDLLLQSLCDHNIIANSTFSWWAAWLNSNPHKIVIAPDEWYTTNDFSARDIYPDGWIKMS